MTSTRAEGTATIRSRTGQCSFISWRPLIFSLETQISVPEFHPHFSALPLLLLFSLPGAATWGVLVRCWQAFSSSSRPSSSSTGATRGTSPLSDCSRSFCFMQYSNTWKGASPVHYTFIRSSSLCISAQRKHPSFLPLRC